MARRSPRGQFSGHLPLTHCSFEGERRRGGGASCQEGPEACTYGGGERRGGGEEWARGGRWRPLGGWELEPLVVGVVEEGGRRANKEDKEKIQVSVKVYQILDPGGRRFKSGRLYFLNPLKQRVSVSNTTKMTLKALLLLGSVSDNNRIKVEEMFLLQTANWAFSRPHWLNTTKAAPFLSPE